MISKNYIKGKINLKIKYIRYFYFKNKITEKIET